MNNHSFTHRSGRVPLVAVLLACGVSLLLQHAARAEEKTNPGALPEGARQILDAEPRGQQDVAYYKHDDESLYEAHWTVPSGLRVRLKVKPNGTPVAFERTNRQPNI